MRRTICRWEEHKSQTNLKFRATRLMIDDDDELNETIKSFSKKENKTSNGRLKVHNSPIFPFAALISDHEPFVIGVSFRCTSNIYLALEGFREGRRT